MGAVALEWTIEFERLFQSAERLVDNFSLCDDIEFGAHGKALTS